MYFVVDGLLIGIFFLALWSSIRRGFSGHFVFGILRTIIGIAVGAVTVFGVYMLMKHFSWIEYMADGVIAFFGELTTSFIPNDLYRMVMGIVAFAPFAVLFFIVGYLIGVKVICGLIKLIFTPIKLLRNNAKVFRIIDNVLGTVINLALYCAVVFAIFGVVYVFNYDKDNVPQAEVSTIAMATPDEGEDAKILARTINNITTPTLGGLHESFSAAPIGHVFYENNPLMWFKSENGEGFYTLIHNALIDKK